MTTTIFLVRHATHDLLGQVLTGRIPGVPLGATGRAEAERLADRLAREGVAAVYTSPLDRARETATPIAARCGVEAEPTEALTDVEYGEWSGRRFEDLESDPRWFAWNAHRTTARPPGGETMLEVQCRAVGEVGRLVEAHAESGAVLVSHSDVIKSVLCFYLGLAVDAFARFEVSPASISTVAIGEWGARVHAMNEVVAA